MANKVEIIITGNNVYAVNAIDGTKKKLGTLDKKTKSVSKSMKMQFKMIGGAMLTAFSVGGAIMLTKQLVTMGLNLEGVKRAFMKLSNAPQLLERLTIATKGTVSNLHLMQLALRAKNFRIPLDLLAKGLEFAKIRARETGESIDYMVNSLVTGLGRQSIKIIDNLGISALEVRAEMEKTGDFITAVGKIMDRELRGMDRAFVSTKEKIEQMNVKLKNTKAQIGLLMTPVVLDFFEAVELTIRDISNIAGFTADVFAPISDVFSPPAVRRIQEYSDHLRSIGLEADNMGDRFIWDSEDVRRLGNNLEWVNKNISRTKTALELAEEHVRNLGAGYRWADQYIKNFGKSLSGSIDEITTTTNTLTEEQIAAAKRLGEQWKGISTTLQKDIMLAGLSPQAAKLMKLNMKAEEYRQKFGSIPGALSLINDWYDTLIKKEEKLANPEFVDALALKQKYLSGLLASAAEQPLTGGNAEIFPITQMAAEAQIAQDHFNVIAATYSNMFGAMGSAALAFYNASDREGRAWFEWYKGLMITQTIASTFVGAQEAFKTVTAVAGPIAGYAAAVSAVAYGLGNVARISSLEPGGRGGGAPPTPSGGGYANNTQTTNNNNSGQYYFTINIVGGDNITDFDKDKLARELMESLRKAQGDGA